MTVPLIRDCPPFKINQGNKTLLNVRPLQPPVQRCCWSY